MKHKQIIKWFLLFVLAYIAIGTIYYLTGYLYNLIVSHQNVFAPIVGLPLTLIGWPGMVYADLRHHNQLGLKPSTLITLLSAIIFLIASVWHTVRSKKSRTESPQTGFKGH